MWRGPKCWEAHPAPRFDSASISVTSAKSNENTRPRMRSGTNRWIPYVESVHCAPPPTPDGSTARVWHVEALVVLENLPFELAQLRPGLEPELVR